MCAMKSTGFINKEVMHRNLLDFKRVMDENEVKFVFIFGTLLGVVRDGDLIDWDTDVDVAGFAPDIMRIPKVISQMEKLGFTKQEGTPDHDTNFIRDGEKIEIWWFEKNGDEWVYDPRIRYKAEYFDKAVAHSFLDTEWLVPHNKEKFLDITYGGDWRIPNANKSYIIGVS